MNEQISSSSMFRDLVKSIIVGFHNQYNSKSWMRGRQHALVMELL